MKERITPSPENISAKLLATLRRLFGDIESQGNVDLVAEANAVKLLIFQHLQARNKIDPNTSYETWVKEYFPSPATLDNSRLIELAKEQDLISNAEETEFLRKNLQQIHRAYRGLGVFRNSQIGSEVASLIAKDEITLKEYRDLADRLIRQIYN